MNNKSPKRVRTAHTYVKQTVTSPRNRKITIGTNLDDSIAVVHEEKQQLEFTIGEKDVEIERMKTTLVALNGKLGALTDVEKEVIDQRRYFVESETKRGDIQVHITDLAKKIKSDAQDHEAKHDRNISDIQKLREEIQGLKVQMNQRESEHFKTIDQMNQDHFSAIQMKDKELADKQREYKDNLTRKENQHLDATKTLQENHSKTLKDRDNEHQSELRQLDQEKTRREKEYIARTNKMQNEHANELKERQERHETEMKLAETRHQEEKRRLEYEMKDQKERAEVKLKLEKEAAAKKLHETITEHNEEMRKFRDDQERKDRDHRDQVDKMRAEAERNLRELQKKHDSENREREERHNRELKQKITEMQLLEKDLKMQMESLRIQKDLIIADLTNKMDEQRSMYELRINKLTITIETYEKQILVLKSRITSLEEELYKKKDVEKQLEEFLQREKDYQAARDKLVDELQNATDYILELEEKVYKANKTSLELLKQLKDAELEIDTLKQYIIDLKQRIAVYIPVREDPVDRKLAEFINNYPERQKLKIMFMRESEGVYQFGTKRVAVKVEKDNIKIRVGGGYLSLDEFLDQYTPTELEKLERKDPLKRFSEKIAVQKTIVNQPARETSPVRSPMRSDSPKKSTR